MSGVETAKSTVRKPAAGLDLHEVGLRRKEDST